MRRAALCALAVTALVAGCGSGAPSTLNVGGHVVWNFEALLHDLGGHEFCLGGAGVGFDVTTKPCPSGAATYYAPVFSGARHSSFHLARTHPGLFVWTPVRINGRLVACDARETTFVGHDKNSANFAMACVPPAR